MLKKIGLLLVCIVSFIGLSGCGTTQRVNNISQNSLPLNLSLSQVEQAILAAGEYKKWSMKVIEPGYIQADIKVRTHKAGIDIRYTPERYSIHLRSSENLKQKGDEIHRNYNKWVILLDNEIQKNLTGNK